VVAAEVASFLRERAALIASATPGPEAARALSRVTDRAVSALAETALSPLGSPWVVLALGGWGAARLLPHSDLDLLVVTDAPSSELKPAVSQVLYPLWDAGLKIGHQVRSRRDHERAARDDAQTLTATLTGRVLCGDSALGARLLGEVAAGARKRSKRIVRELTARRRPGSPYLLEPDLKEGAGGQRDLDEMTWVGAVLTGEPGGSPSALARAGVIGARESERLEAAAARITAARWAVHAQVTRATSVMTLDLAADSGLDLEAVQAALADAHHLLLRARARLGHGSAYFDIGSGRADRPLASADLFELLERGDDALEELEEAAWAGLLDDLVPSFGELMHARRPALSHRYTVGAHSLRCATGIVAAVRSLPRAGAGWPRVPDSRVLLAAALVHDVGKGQSGRDHAARGAASLRTIGVRLGLDAARLSDAELLVREHLLLPETAASADTHDEDVILRTAGRIGRRDLLSALHALTVADSLATGPGAWTAWHSALVGELVDRLDAALGDEVEGAGIARRAEATRASALALAAADPDAEALLAFVRRAPLRYLAANLPVDILTHGRLAAAIAASGDSNAAELAVSPGPVEGTWRASVAAHDRPGFFAAACGALALAGLDIVAADAYDAPGGVALDVFVVRSDTLAGVEPSTWAAVQRNLRAALVDPAALDTRLGERRRHYRVLADVPTRVETETAESYATAVRVRAADRVGLLYDIARAFAETGLDIRWARALTQDGVAQDVFHVTDGAGEPLDDPGVIGHLAMRIRERVGAGA
jgi:[protein-PII] uridylyltransferase